MMIGVLGFAILAGFVAGGGALIMGLGVWAALTIYAGTGALVLFGVVAQAMIEAFHEGRGATADGPISLTSGVRKDR